MIKSAFLLLLSAAACPSATILYSISNTGDLYSTNTSLTSVTSIGSGGVFSPGSGYIGLAANGTGVGANLYTFSSTTNSFYQVDTATGTQTLTRAISSGFRLDANSNAVPISEGDIVFTSATSGFLASQGFSAWDFYSFNLNSSALTLLGSCVGVANASAACADGINRTGLDGLYSDGAVLYGFQGNNTNARGLVTVNTANGNRTLVGSTGQQANTGGNGGLAKDPNSSNIWAVISNNLTAGLFNVNISSGAFTSIGTITGVTANQALVGLAYLTTADVVPVIPEPSTIILMASAVVVLYLRRRF